MCACMYAGVSLCLHVCTHASPHNQRTSSMSLSVSSGSVAGSSCTMNAPIMPLANCSALCVYGYVFFLLCAYVRLYILYPSMNCM